MEAPAFSADQIYAQLIRDIMGGRLSPGAPMAEVQLALRFGVSRTPIRQALHRLDAEGMIERGPRRAFIVRRMNQDALRDLFESLGEIEALCTGLAARRMTAMEQAALARIVDEGDAHDADYAEANRRFHEALRLGAKNAILAELSADLNRRSMPWRDAQFDKGMNRVDSSRAEHRAIMEAVIAHDADRASGLMRAHMATSLGVIEKLLQGKLDG
ncbi:GntR family transcriptional regulator [Paracoccus sp. 1_MG-2023]|uniref:GntR family transcriptional regulator n=1 Tax=unclassified Paracoccus (in: a-proteobacteria) TaxID=2688777 RepID=UPI001C09E36A|nr:MULTISPECIES: GntR family transcriptional regulator [unclassified Paracoccus (in: a-proteobacteria)]MBU2958469.1 GntR family transcriptional regulator [Paracoccus sp. C2R09]MDO6668546.1 GntR family transcriptional regulator [Paracoccus sp. 1_MG-2023]